MGSWSVRLGLWRRFSSKVLPSLVGLTKALARFAGASSVVQVCTPPRQPCSCWWLLDVTVVCVCVRCVCSCVRQAAIREAQSRTDRLELSLFNVARHPGLLRGSRRVPTGAFSDSVTSSPAGKRGALRGGWLLDLFQTVAWVSARTAAALVRGPQLCEEERLAGPWLHSALLGGGLESVSGASKKKSKKAKQPPAATPPQADAPSTPRATRSATQAGDRSSFPALATMSPDHHGPSAAWSGGVDATKTLRPTLSSASFPLAARSMVRTRAVNPEVIAWMRKTLLRGGSTTLPTGPAAVAAVQDAGTSDSDVLFTWLCHHSPLPLVLRTKTMAASSAFMFCAMVYHAGLLPELARAVELVRESGVDVRCDPAPDVAVWLYRCVVVHAAVCGGDGLAWCALSGRQAV